ncbi:UNKNOWN [Stylonychia lemnae]|uniref:Glycosyltransferase 2-like domain-containing protein n=1 Tax=Stylonychia lemnae TaxID=5949 RepID=A0A078A2L9_STYLE|nr:UNKNOWN [Stylonychia lemnae]|eukprot:CDW75029.1 UNKNOWN [Stylonychia lemnae]
MLAQYFFFTAFLFLIMTKISKQLSISQDIVQKDLITILIYGDASIDDIDRQLNYTLPLQKHEFEVIVAIKNKSMVDMINPLYKNEEKIKFIENQDVDDFAKILQAHFNNIQGEYIVLIQAKTQSKINRTKEQLTQMKTYNCNVSVTDLEIINEADEVLDNSYLIDIDYTRNLDLILFSEDFRFYATLLISKAYLGQILISQPSINKYDAIQRIVKDGDIHMVNTSLVQMTFKQYQEMLFQDTIMRPQQDHIKYMHYNSHLNRINIKIQTVQFSKLLNCSFDYLLCDEDTMSLVGYLIMHSYLTDNLRDPFNSSSSGFLQTDSLKHIEYIYSYLNLQEIARQNPKAYPLASVIMACYNRDYYLWKSIQHVLQQTYVNWELIISDDGSNNPKTRQILQLVQNHPRIRVFYLHTNQYAVFALNHGISQAKGEYLSIQDDDDIMVPFRLNYQIDFLRRNQKYEACGTNYIVINEIGYPSSYGGYRVKNFAQTKFTYLFLNHIPHSSFTVRLTPRMKKHFIYNHSTAYDYSLWFKLIFDLNEDIRFAVLPNPVTGIRFHRQRMTHDSIETQHYGKWIPVKQIEIAERIIPDIFDNLSYKCYLETLYKLNYEQDVETCKDQDIHQFLSQINNGLRNLPQMSQNDISNLDQIFDRFHIVYDEKLKEDKVKYLHQRRTFDCVLHFGKIELLLLHIDQLKDYVDYFAIIYLIPPQEQVTLDEIFKHQVIQDNQQKLLFELINVTEEEYEQYQTNLDKEIAYKFTKLLLQRKLFYHEEIILTNSHEIINPYQLRRFQKLNADFGIFGLRPLSIIDLQEGRQYSQSKIMTYKLFEQMGYQKVRNFTLDLDIFKKVGQPAFEDKIQTLIIDKDYINIHTLKDAGVYVDEQDDCRSSFQSQILSQTSNQTFAEKRKLQNFFTSIRVDLQSMCYQKYKLLYKMLDDEL